MASAYIEMKIPTFLGSRASAEEFVHKFGAVAYMPIIIDFAGNNSTAQGACDEIVKRLLLAEVSEIFLINQTEKITRWFSDALNMRDDSRTTILIA